MKMSKFITTKQYKKFSEFCRACERDNFIGLCYGPPGAGKTAAARHYTKWDKLNEGIKDFYNLEKIPKTSIKQSNSILYTPSQLDTPKQTIYQIKNDIKYFGYLKEKILFPTDGIPGEERNKHFARMVIIDEAERLKPQVFEIIREIYDEGKTNFIFVGMPGVEKILARYPQLYSRIGFLHRFENMTKSELAFILSTHLSKVNNNLKDDDYTDEETIAAILRMTDGNFRLVDRLIKQSLRIMKVNCMTNITKEIVEAARTCLLIG